MKPPAAWQEFETLVFNLQKRFSQHGTVTKGERLYGHNSETNRQIDVVVRTAVNGEPILMIVEYKCLATKVDVKDVDAFVSVKDDVRAHLGVMVSSNGFTDAAYKTAKAKNISLYRYEDSLKKGWPSGLETWAILETWFLTPTHAYFICEDGTEEIINSDENLNFMEKANGESGPFATLLRKIWDSQPAAEKHDRSWEYRVPISTPERPEIVELVFGATSKFSKCYRPARLQFEGQVDDRAKSAKTTAWKLVVSGDGTGLTETQFPPFTGTYSVIIATTHVSTADPKSEVVHALLRNGVLEVAGIKVPARNSFELNRTCKGTENSCLGSMTSASSR